MLSTGVPTVAGDRAVRVDVRKIELQAAATETPLEFSSSPLQCYHNTHGPVMPAEKEQFLCH